MQGPWKSLNFYTKIVGTLSDDQAYMLSALS